LKFVETIYPDVFFLMTRSWPSTCGKLMCISIKKGYLPNPMKGQQWTVYIRTGFLLCQEKTDNAPIDVCKAKHLPLATQHA